MGILTSKKIANLKYFQAEKRSPLFSELLRVHPHSRTDYLLRGFAVLPLLHVDPGVVIFQGFNNIWYTLQGFISAMPHIF
jgi:hypothetical protein